MICLIIMIITIINQKNIFTEQNKLTRLTEKDKRITDPAVIYTSAEDLKEKLQFYKRVKSNDIASIPLGTRIKYIEVLPDGKFKYKPGGVIIVNKAPEYLVLAANRKSWSVQLSKHIIFIEQFEMVRKNYEKTIRELTAEVEKLRETVRKVYKIGKKDENEYEIEDDDIQQSKLLSKPKSKYKPKYKRRKLDSE